MRLYLCSVDLFARYGLHITIINTKCERHSDVEMT